MTRSEAKSLQDGTNSYKMDCYKRPSQQGRVDPPMYVVDENIMRCHLFPMQHLLCFIFT